MQKLIWTSISTTGGNDIIPKVIGNLINTPLFQVVTQQTEDCLTMRVQRPAGTKAGDKLPVFLYVTLSTFVEGVLRLT